MLITKRYCPICKTARETTIDKVAQKIDMYYATCDKGHIYEIFISKKLIKALKESQ